MKLQTLLTSLALCFCLGGGKLYAQTYISSRSELNAFAAAVNDGSFGSGTAYLIADIPMGTSWKTPIGTADHPFQGSFEGWGHKISNLVVDSSNDYVGLFGYIDGGSVEDVGIESGDIKGGSYVGGICGYLKSGEISSCYSKVAIEGYQYVGGLCGYSAGKIENCWHTGEVKGTATSEVCAGGLVGFSNEGTLQRCYVFDTRVKVDNITSWNPYVENDGMNAYFGLIIGRQEGTKSKINNCIYNSFGESVYITNLDNAQFLLGNDVTVGSVSGGFSPASFTNLTGATTAQMQKRFFWIYDSSDPNGFGKNLLNDEEDELALNNEVWYIVDGKYPELHSFYDKGKDITFKFTDTKKWLTIVPNGNYAVPDGVTAYKVMPTGVDGTTVTLTSVGYLYEGCGALIYSEGGVDKIATSTSNRLSSDDYADWQSNNLLKGSPTSPDYIGEVTLATSKDFVLKNTASGPQFGKVTGGMIARGKAYLHWEGPSSAKLSLTVMDEEEATCIESVDSGQLTDDTWYTLSGVKLTSTPTEKGVYIHNGRKEAVR